MFADLIFSCISTGFTAVQSAITFADTNLGRLLPNLQGFPAEPIFAIYLSETFLYRMLK